MPKTNDRNKRETVSSINNFPYVNRDLCEIISQTDDF